MRVSHVRGVFFFLDCQMEWEPKVDHDKLQELEKSRGKSKAVDPEHPELTEKKGLLRKTSRKQTDEEKEEKRKEQEEVCFFLSSWCPPEHWQPLGVWPHCLPAHGHWPETHP